MTDLGFDIHLGGRAAKALSAEVVRELTTSDLGLLATERSIKPTHLQRITDRHHALARCLATGMSATEAGLVTGYTGSRISVLRGDPSFEELIAFYQRENAPAVLGLSEKLIAIANDSADVLLDRLELEPESFARDELVDNIKLGADRSGHGPQSKTTNVNLHVNLGDRMKAARERVPGPAKLSHEAPLAPTTIEGTFSRKNET